jgi:hypothetical protein
MLLGIVLVLTTSVAVGIFLTMVIKLEGRNHETWL